MRLISIDFKLELAQFVATPPPTLPTYLVSAPARTLRRDETRPRDHTMPPHLHPRSRMTSSLFATTVVASFLVVGLPHILPCPAPRVAYADAASPDGSPRCARRRSSQQTTEVKDGIAQFEGVSDVSGSNRSASVAETSAMTSTAPRGKRECPVPKPGGVIGELIGFKRDERSDTSRPPKENTVEKISTSNNR
ncbi:hypothetical protein CIB48_g4343 [Xylaria polymorpha]|nr:hypothetical protein CIB48_g4343 [Xylaria polymorpha]